MDHTKGCSSSILAVDQQLKETKMEPSSTGLIVAVVVVVVAFFDELCEIGGQARPAY
jgi:hypothetical protein